VTTCSKTVLRRILKHAGSSSVVLFVICYVLFSYACIRIGQGFIYGYIFTAVCSWVRPSSCSTSKDSELLQHQIFNLMNLKCSVKLMSQAGSSPGRSSVLPFTTASTPVVAIRKEKRGTSLPRPLYAYASWDALNTAKTFQP
jgi:hypothetical protein